MRKVMLLAAMLAMVLAAAVPAFAQDAVAVDDSVAQGGDVQYVDCSQVQAALQGQYGDAVADDEAVAAVASEQGITQNQVNACLGEVSDVNQGNDNVGDVVEDDDATAAAAAEADASAAAAAAAGSAAAAGGGSAAAAAASAPAELPETGGASLLALGAGALLVAGGLVARRIVR
jgi:LPXTG-motif cell wall-anchored protein